MKIGFENRCVNAFDKVCDETVRVRDAAESVIPDTQPDVVSIVSVQKSVYLKSKDVTGRGVSVTGEARADIIYICEGETEISAHTIAKTFTMDFDIPDIDLMSVPVITLSAENAQVRIVNPRKLAVSFAVSGRVECYSPSQIMTEQLMTEDVPLHLKLEERQQLYTAWAGEKTFAVNEQFLLPGGARAKSICSKRTEFSVTDRQCVGTKLLVKGMAHVSLCWLPDNEAYPVNTDFSTPFSQLIDCGLEDTGGFDVQIETTSMYADITESISGGCAVDCEIHAVIQCAAYAAATLSFYADAYSNRTPCECTCRDMTIMCEKRYREEPKEVQQTVELPEDCADVLCLMSAVTSSASEESGGQALALDVLYRTTDGRMSAVHRSVEIGRLEGKYRLTKLQTDFDGKRLDLDISGSIDMCEQIVETVGILDGIDLSENGYDTTQWPSLYAVRTERESLWQLAKTYHSSVERICAANADVTDQCGRVLLIPKE